MHIVVIPSWYPSSETDVDGIFSVSKPKLCNAKA